MKTAATCTEPGIRVPKTVPGSAGNKREPALQKFVPRSLCRCGRSCHKPFCDGRHADTEWLPTLQRSPRKEKLSGISFFTIIA